MYRHCLYNNKTKSIHLYTWSADGERVTQEIPYSPYVMLEDRSGEFRSIYGTKLKKKEFQTQWDRYKFQKESGVKRIFENIPANQQFLIDNYYHCNNDDDFSKHPLKVMYLDLECPGNLDKGEDDFPDPEYAKYVINLLTCYDSLTKRYTMFGLKPYNHGRANLDYIHCKSEEELLKKVVRHISSDYPDIMIGYNSIGFDFPYLINRIVNVLGEEWSRELSPIGRIYEKVNKTGKFGKPSKEYVVEGISLLDMQIMYKKFEVGEKLDSYKLDRVAEFELEENKVEYDGNLWELSKQDWSKYCDYNFVDVELLVKLEDKLKYIDLLRFISYLGLCNIEKAVDTVPIITGAIAVQARRRGEYIPTFIKLKHGEDIPGGYVEEPIAGFSDRIVTFDANSLYPSVMISLNLSPETKIGKLELDGDEYKLYHVSGKRYEMTKPQLRKFMDSEKCSIANNGFLFSQKKKGVAPEFLDLLYTQRKAMKGKMLKCKGDGDKEGAKTFDTIQNAYKIVLNSTYGYFVNDFAPLADKDIGSAVTLTGQAIINKSVVFAIDFIKNLLPEENPETFQKIYKYCDTDSQFVDFFWTEKMGISLKDDDGEISQEFIDICQKFEDNLNKNMREWVSSKFKSVDPRIVFKREAICDSSFLLKKKYYVLHILNDEGNKCDKFKYRGVDVVKTTMPRALKPYVKNIIETMVMTKDKDKTNRKFLDAYDVYKKLGPESIYVISTINNYNEWIPKCDKLNTAKGMPHHLKAALAHDYLIEELGLVSKYPKFQNGDKIKMVELKTPNKYGISKIGYKGKWPEEFDQIFTIDFEKMFGKIMYAAIERFFAVAGWVLRKPNENLKIELEDFLS